MSTPATDQGSAVGRQEAPRLVECPRCNPLSPETDEQGRPYTCYCCGDTGWVPADSGAP